MAQVPLAKNDDMVKTFPPDRANQPFHMAILPWRLGCSWPVANAHGAKPPGENFAIDSVAIADEVLRCVFPATGFGELPVSLSEIKFEHSYGVIHRELVSGGFARRHEQPAVPAHPCSERDVSVR